MSTFHARGFAASLHEHALLEAAQRDDRRALDELLRRYEPLVRATSRRLRLPYCCDRRDIAQEARLGLLRAIGAWQPARGPFRAFAAHCVLMQAIKALDAAGAHKHQLLSRALPLGFGPTAGRPNPGEPGRPSARLRQLEPTSRVADPVAMLLVRERLDSMLAVLPALTTIERAVLTGVLNGKSQQQLADEHGLSRKAVAAALRRARAKLAVPEARAA